jgi:hypothetical protein
VTTFWKGAVLSHVDNQLCKMEAKQNEYYVYKMGYVLKEK